MGVKYSFSDYVIVGWQPDDLPRFGLIKDIFVAQDICYILVQEYKTIGIDRHYHSFCIEVTDEEVVFSINGMFEHHTFRAHRTDNGYLCITFSSHIEKHSA